LNCKPSTLERLTQKRIDAEAYRRRIVSIHYLNTMHLWTHHNPCPCVGRSRSLRKQTYCIRSANDTWVSSRDASWIDIIGIIRELSSFCYYLSSIPC